MGLCSRKFIVEQAGGVIYYNTKMHIAANNEAYLEMMKNYSFVNDDEEMVLKRE